MADSWESLPDVKTDDWEKLPDVAPEGKVPSPTGWRKPGEHKFSDISRDMERQDEAMWAALAAGAHGPAAAMEGPINGALNVFKSNMAGMAKGQPLSWDEIVSKYREGRDPIEAAQKENLGRFPNAPIVGSVLTGGAGSAPTAAGRVGLSAIQGGVYGFGSSPADLTKGEVKDAAKDTAIGTAAGAGAGLVGELIRLPGKWLAGKAQGISDATHAAKLAAETEARQAAANSARGSEGGLTAAGMKAWDRLGNAMFNPAASEENKQWARQFINSDEGKALYNQVLSNYAEEAPKMLGRLAAAKSARAAAEAANQPDLIKQAASKAAEEALADPSGVTSRLAELGRRNLPTAIGSAVAGPAGAAAGSLYSGMAGKQGRILTNMLNSPSAFMPLIKAASVPIGTGKTVQSMAPEALEQWSKFLKPDEGDE